MSESVGVCMCMFSLLGECGGVCSSGISLLFFLLATFCKLVLLND